MLVQVALNEKEDLQRNAKGMSGLRVPILTIVPFDLMSMVENDCTMRMTEITFVSKVFWTSSNSNSMAATA